MLVSVDGFEYTVLVPDGVRVRSPVPKLTLTLIAYLTLPLPLP